MLETVPNRFSFPLKTISAAINLVVFGLISLRGAQKTFGYFSVWFKGSIPSYVTIQQWIMRVGLFKLRSPVETRDDWVYILDHTIEYGTQKCLVILGFTLETFRKNKCVICHRDVEVLAIQIDENATATTVTAALQEVSRNTGKPAQIISDGGINLKKGIVDFIGQKGNQSVRYTYDVTHKAALILKHYLQDDEEWNRFVEHTSQTKRSLVHTALAHIAPPKPREKSRWLNLGPYMKWFSKSSCIDKRKLNKKERIKYKEKLCWLPEFKSKTVEWDKMLEMVNSLAKEVKANGFSCKTELAFNKTIADLEINSSRLKNVKSEIIEYICTQCQGVDYAVPGCSDIIESVFGKYKSFSGKSPMKAIGKTILMIPVFTSDINPKEIKKALEAISEKDVKVWLEKNIGKSLFSRRIRAFGSMQVKSSVKKNHSRWENCA